MGGNGGSVVMIHYPGDIRINIAHLLPAIQLCAPVTVLAGGAIYATLRFTDNLVADLNRHNIPWSFD